MTPDPFAPLSPRGRISGAFLLAAIIIAVFLPATRGELVYDDLYLIAQNPQITSFSHLPEIFRSAHWDFLDAETSAHVGYYRPLASVVLTAGYALGHGSPAVFHWISLATHVAAALAAWLFAARLSGSERIGFWAALLFALHPLQVESVAWISAVNVPLFAFFSLLSLAAWIGWRRRGSAGMPWAAGLLLLPALFGKEAAVAVVPIALAIDLARGIGGREEEARRAPFLRAYLPFALAGALYYLARVATFDDWRAGFDRITTDFGVAWERLAFLRVELLGGCVRLLLLPLELNLFRPFQPALEPASRAFLEPLAWSLLFAALLVILAARRARTALAAALLIPAALLPVLANVQSLGTFPLSDRFLYLPVLGFTVLVAGLAFTRLPRPAAIAALGLLAASYGYRSLLRLPDWTNEEALFVKAVEQNPRNPNVHWGLGRVLLSRYRAEGGPAALASARASYERAMLLLEEAGRDQTIFATSDDHRQTNLGLAWTLLFQAQLDEFHDYQTPKVVFERVTSRYPGYYMGWIGLGVALSQMGELAQAGEALRKGLDLNPRSVEGHHNMAALLLMLRDWKGAEEHYREALRWRADDLDDLVGLSRALELQDRREEARRTAMRARELHPSAPDPAVILGALAMREGGPAEALRWLDEAILCSPAHGPAHLRRGMVLAAMQQPKEAAKAFQKACELMPRDFEAFYNLSSILLASETAEAAIPVLVRAYALRENDQLGLAVHKSLVDLELTQPDVCWQLAAIDADRGDRERAMSWVQRALELDPDHAPSHYLVGNLLVEEGRSEEALDHLTRAAVGLGDSYQAQVDLGSLLLDLGRAKEALPYLERARMLLDREPFRPDVKQALSERLAQQIARLEEAISGADREGD